MDRSRLFIPSISEFLGLGSEGKKNDKVWMAHHDDFESLLANLNKSKKDDSVEESISSDKASVNSEEKDATQSRIQTRLQSCFPKGGVGITSRKQAVT